MLAEDLTWDFDVLRLEKITDKRCGAEKLLGTLEAIMIIKFVLHAHWHWGVYLPY